MNVKIAECVDINDEAADPSERSEKNNMYTISWYNAIIQLNLYENVK